MVRRDQVGLIDGDTRLTYGELDRRIAGARAGLRELGLASGDRVAGLALNSFRHLEAWMAIPTANLIFNDLNFRLALAELEFIVNDSGARVLLADARHWETAVALLERCDCLEQLVWMERRRLRPTARRRGTSSRGDDPIPTARRPRRRLRRRHHLHGRHDRSAEGRDADARQPDGQRQAHAVGQPAVPRRPLPAPHADVPLGGRRQHVRPDARRPARTSPARASTRTSSDA